MGEPISIVYAPGSERRRMLVCAPEGAWADAALVWFHGGGFTCGEPEWGLNMARELSALGVCACLPAYRLSPEAEYPDFIRDAALAVRAFVDWLHARGRAQRILLGGSSAGAYLSMMLFLDKRYLSEAGLSPEDIAGCLFNAGQSTAHFHVLSARGEDEKRVIVDETAPLYHVCVDTPRRPISILCAENDIPSRVTQNALLHETLLRFGASPEQVTMEILPGYQHCGYDGARDDNGRLILTNRVLSLMGRARKEA